MERHSDAIELIKSEIAVIGNELSKTGGDEDLVRRKSALMNSLQLLRQLSGCAVAPKAKIFTIPLPANNGHFSEIRLLDDQETEDRSYWTEVEIEGESVRAIVGDILILNSEKR